MYYSKLLIALSLSQFDWSDIFALCVLVDDGALSWEEFRSFFADGVMSEEELRQLFHDIDTHNTKYNCIAL